MSLSDFIWATVHGIGQIFQFVKYYLAFTYRDYKALSEKKKENINFLMRHEIILEQKAQHLTQPLL